MTRICAILRPQPILGACLLACAYLLIAPLVIGDAKLAERFGGVLGLPLSYLIDAQGRVVARYEGEADLPKMEARLRELLAHAHQ